MEFLSNNEYITHYNFGNEAKAWLTWQFIAHRKVEKCITKVSSQEKSQKHMANYAEIRQKKQKSTVLKANKQKSSLIFTHLNILIKWIYPKKS